MFESECRLEKCGMNSLAPFLTLFRMAASFVTARLLILITQAPSEKGVCLNGLNKSLTFQKKTPFETGDKNIRMFLLL